MNCSAKFSQNPESMSKSKPLTKRAWHSGIASNVVCQIGGSLRCAGHCLTHNFRDQPEGGRPQRKAERWFHVLFKWFQFRLQLTCESVGSSKTSSFSLLIHCNSLKRSSFFETVCFFLGSKMGQGYIRQTGGPSARSFNQFDSFPRTNPRHLPASVSIHEKMWCDRVRILILYTWYMY